MTEAIYKVGDILEFTEVVPKQFGLFGLWVAPVRGLVVKINDLGDECLSYRLLLFGTVGTTKDMALIWTFEKNIIPAAKRVGHIDISLLRFEEQEEPDYAMFFTAATIAQAADLKNENEKLKAENKDLHEKLANERKILEQKIKCAEKHFDSAAAALYEGREHLSMSIRGMTGE